MKHIAIFFLCFYPFFSFATGEINPTIEQETAENINYSLDLETEIQKDIKDSVSINTLYKIDLSNLYKNLKILSPEKEYEFFWELKWASSQTGMIYERTFKEKWEKELNLTINEFSKVTLEDDKTQIQSKIIFSKAINILVFEKSFFLIYSDEIFESDIQNYINFSKTDGIYISKIGPLSKTDIEVNSILTSILKYQNDSWLKSDFITIWGSRDFIFNIMSKISGEIQKNEEYKNARFNILSISAYNINILESYLKNFLANKPWLNKLVLINEESKYNVLKYNLIDELIQDLYDNKYTYINVNLAESQVNNFFFISKFINNLSNLWYTTRSIYLFLIIPIILTVIIFFKHFVWISPIWLVIPLFITLLFFKIWLIAGLVFLFLYIALNLLLSLLVSRFNLLYAPKMAFLLNINIVFFILMFNIAQSLHLAVINLSDIIFFIIFIIMSEKMITIIISKDLLEYKEAFVFTILISVLCFIILDFNQVRILTLAYPEILLALIPINFLIGRFSWLRITEYFRFKEIIKSIEE